MDEHNFPAGNPDERELLLGWLGFLRGAVLRNLAGLDEQQARWTPGGALLPVLGVVNHLTYVEWRWIDGAMLGHEVERSEEEFHPGTELTVDQATQAYLTRAAATDDVVRRLPLE